MNIATNHPSTDPAGPKADGSTAHGLDAAARAGHRSFDALAGDVEAMRGHAGAAAHDLAARAEGLARHGAAAVRERALHARDTGSDYVRGHPLQSLLIAAAAGAALVLVARLFGRRGD